jgi:hypothetical protein
MITPVNPAITVSTMGPWRPTSCRRPMIIVPPTRKAATQMPLM